MEFILHPRFSILCPGGGDMYPHTPARGERPHGPSHGERNLGLLSRAQQLAGHSQGFGSANGGAMDVPDTRTQEVMCKAEQGGSGTIGDL